MPHRPVMLAPSQTSTSRRCWLAAVVTASALAVACVPAHAASVAPAPKLTVSPAPGTPDASPATQISVLGVTPRCLAKVTVTGSVSGTHTGALKPYSGHRGASFVLKQPLTPGETAKVTVAVTGHQPLAYAFTVARFGPAQPLLNITVTQPDKLDHFVTRPDLQAPVVTVNKNAAKTSGSVFMTPLPSPIIHPGAVNTVSLNPVGPGGPMIVDARGQLVWFKQLTPPAVAANLAVQRYRGRPVLTWWEGSVTVQAFGLGVGIVADTSYRTIATVHTGNGYQADIHEFTLTRDGDALMTVYSPVLVHLPGTPAGTLSSVLDAIVQEVDIHTGLVVWEWHALGHVPLADSYATQANSASLDAYHINSVQPLPDHHVLISARDASAIYDVDRQSGKIAWTLGGKASTFKLGPGARFWLQHDARMLPGDRVSLFDDEAGPPRKKPYSRGLILALDRKKKTATVVQSYARSAQTSAQSEGSTQVRPGGHVFVGFGATGFFSEFTADGKLLFDANLPDGDGSYRTLRLPWTATPTTRPTVAAQRTDAAHVSVYASWNGATAVARWQVLSAETAGGALRAGASVPRTGFETRIDVAGTATTFAVRALSARGRVLSTSSPTPAL